jgi:uncharacterized protein (DUF3820 family)
VKRQLGVFGGTEHTLPKNSDWNRRLWMEGTVPYSQTAAVPTDWNQYPAKQTGNQGNLHSMKPEDLELLVTREMPFGKHKGRLIADLPGNYLNWFAREGFPPGEIGRLLALMHEIDHNGLKELLTPLRRR